MPYNYKDSKKAEDIEKDARELVSASRRKYYKDVKTGARAVVKRVRAKKVHYICCSCSNKFSESGRCPRCGSPNIMMESR